MKNNSFKNLSVLEDKWINNNNNNDDDDDDDDDDDGGGGDDDDDDCDENNKRQLLQATQDVRFILILLFPANITT